jgi:Histidine kinase-like ATPase domain
VTARPPEAREAAYAASRKGSGAGSAADSVVISIARDPALVRTVRLVAAAVARRAAVDEGLIEEIRLAIGEACAVMIGLDQLEGEQPATAAAAPGPAGDAPPYSQDGDQVVIRLTLDQGLAAAIEGRLGTTSADLAGLELNPWALLRGLSDEVAVEDAGSRTTVRMSWPAR